jgi:large subunit ribosomal protein L25
MNIIELKVDKRTILGKKNRFMRREGVTPCHLFGNKVESLSLQCTTDVLEKIVRQAGTSRLINLLVGNEKTPKKVFIREIQRHPIRQHLLHVDLFQISMIEKMKADIPIIITGEAPALKGKGQILTHVLNTISVESLPDKLPPEVVIDISGLEELNQSILIKDIDLGADVLVINDPEQVIVKISEVAAARVEDEDEAAVTEGAVEGEGEGEGEAGAAEETKTEE